MSSAPEREAAPARSRVPGWLVDVLAAPVILAAALVPFPQHDFQPTSAAITALVIVPALLLPFRRRWPIPVLAASLAIYGIVALCGTLSPGTIVAATVAMFTVANRYPRRTTLIAGGASVAAVLLLSLLTIAVDLTDPKIFQFALAVAFAAAAGDATRSRREYIHALSERAARAEQTRDAEGRRRVSEERLRIARDLHDAVAHQIAVISLNAGVASSSLETLGDPPKRAQEALGTIRTAARTVLAEIGDLLAMLRADDADAAPTAPQPGLARLDELLQQFASSGLDVTARVDGDPSHVSGAIDHVAYRIIQEALTNAHKHGAGQRAHLLIQVQPEAVTLLITNPATSVRNGDAQNTDRHSRTHGAGHGLIGLRERVASVRGVVETGPTPGGFRIEATLPLPQEPAR